MIQATYHGIMLAVSDAERLDLLTAIEQSGSKWKNNLESDDLYIIVGDNLSAVGMGTIETLKYAWEKAKIFPTWIFKKHLQGEKIDEWDLFLWEGQNKLFQICHRRGDYFSWDFNGIYPGPSIFHHKKMDKDTGVLATMGYHVGNSSSLLPHQRREILRKAYEDYIPWVEGNYMQNWGQPRTQKRLSRISKYLVDMIIKRTEAQNQYFQDNAVCIADWENDLLWLTTAFDSQNSK